MKENNRIWDEWADSVNLGRVYGAQWRDWVAPDGARVDQLAEVIESLKKIPTIVATWSAPGTLVR